jgi:hypothetical protein
MKDVWVPHWMRIQHWFNWEALRLRGEMSIRFVYKLWLVSFSLLLAMTIMKKVFREKVWVHYIWRFSSQHLLSSVCSTCTLFSRGNFLITDHELGFWIILKSLEGRIRDFWVNTSIWRHYFFTIFLKRCKSARIMDTVSLSFELGLFDLLNIWISLIFIWPCMFSKSL